jgi:cytoskeletal protein CcmA (bactofilin family)
MWFVTHSRSDIHQPATTKVAALAVVAVLVVLVHGVAGFGALVTTDRYIVTEDERIGEDQYVTSTSAVIEGTIDGDLTIFSGSVSIVGEVTGNVTAFSSATVRLEPSGSIGGSVQGAGLNLTIEGDVGGDVFYTAGTVVIADTGSVARDVMAFGGTTRIEGSVGRDVRGRSFRTTISGTVGGDVDIATSSLGIDAQADIGGDVLYRSSSDASIEPGATIVGTVTKLPAQSNFLYGIILSLANVVGFLGFLVAGLVALWLARGVGSRAVGAMLTRPVRSLLAGIAFVILLPLSIGLLAVTLVGIPLAIVAIALGVVAFIIGPVPAVAALGNRVLINRGGLFGAFLVGAVLWRLGIWLIPVVGGVIYVVGLVWGLGAWVLGAFAARRGDPTPPMLIPASLLANEPVPGWEPPRAPGTKPAPPPDAPPDDSVPHGSGAHDVAEPAVPVDRSPGDPGSEVAAAATPETPATPAPTVAAAAAAIRFGAPRSDAEDAEVDDAEVDDATGTNGEADEGDAMSLEDRLASFRRELEEAEPEESSDPEAVERFAAMQEELRRGGDDAGVDVPVQPQADDGEPDGDAGDDWGLPRS